MATRTEVQLIDDLDQESPADETVRFALDGKDYEIDLNKYHAQALRENLADFVARARRANRQIKTAVAARRNSGSNREELAAIRQWANENGLKVANRGRIPASVVDAYHAAQ
jgi:hypothetical protein